MLAALGKLAGAPWSWPEGMSIQIADSTTSANRIAFYQILLPAGWQVVDFFDNDTDWPYGEAQQDAPWSYWSEPDQNGGYNVYLLCTPGSGLQVYDFPQQALFDDLTSLNVPLEQLFKSQYGWSLLPQVPKNAH